MATQVQWRGGSTAEHATFTGAAREVTVDTQKQTLVLHDGSTAGGRPLLREDGSNAALALGSAGTPSLKFTGDTNTGLYSPGADQVAISTGGSGRLFVDASGNVTVDYSSASVQSNFRVKTNSAGAAANAYFGIDATDYFRIYVTNGETWLRNPQNTPMAFHTNNTERLRITSAGLVGVGTSSPGNLLHVSGTSSTPATFERTGATGSFVAFKDSTSLVFIGNTNGVFSIQTPGNSYSDKLVVTSAGNVGVGTTSPEARLTTISTATLNGVTNCTFRSSDNATSSFYIGHGSGGISNLVSDSALGFGFNSGGTYLERARIDNSGRLLVGTSSARANFYNSTASAAFQIEGSGTGGRMSVLRSDAGGTLILGYSPTAAFDNAIGTVSFQGNDGSEFVEAASISAVVDGTPGANDMPGRLVFSTTADGASSPTERMRITNKGYVATYCDNVAGSYGLYVASAVAASSSSYLILGTNGATGTLTGTTSFIVATNGNVTNTNNSYGAISDIKLKENIVDAGSQWSDIKALQVRKYNFKEGQTHTQIGLVAQEVELVSPGLVSESPDRDADGNDLGTVTKSVNYSVLYMKAVKALQEAMERIETLEAKVAALESA